jgi:hypothetical protein
MAIYFITGVMVVLGFGLGVLQRGPAGQERMFRPSSSRWLATFVLFFCELLGVAASFYVTKVTLHPGQSTFLLALIIAAANFVGAFAARGSTAELKPLEPFLFFKDGALWPTALPVIANALGVPGAHA